MHRPPVRRVLAEDYAMKPITPITPQNVQEWRVRLALAEERVELVNEELAAFQARVDRVGLSIFW